MAQKSDKLRLLRRIPEIKFEEEANGYSRDQVNRVLANLAPLADEIERLQTRLAEAEQRAASAEARLIEARSPSQTAAPIGATPAPRPDFDETLRNTLVNAQRTADTLVREAKEEAERLRNEAEFQSNALLADAREQADEMTTDAVAQRERLLAEAAAERAKMLDEARVEAQDKVAAVEEELVQAHDGERTRLLEQIGELQEIHTTLQDDVNRFETHLETRRENVKAALDELNGVLDGADALRRLDAPEPEDVGPVNAEDYPTIEVRVEALNRLEGEANDALAETARPAETLMPEELDELAPVDPKALNGQAEQVTEASTDHMAEGTEYGDADYGSQQANGVAAVDHEAAVPGAYDDTLVDHGQNAVSATMAGYEGADQVYDTASQVYDGSGQGYDSNGQGYDSNGQGYDASVQYDEHVQTQAMPAGRDGGVAGEFGVHDEQAATRPPTGDPFLDELRRVTTEEPGVNDPITDFLEDDGTQRQSGGWFGRRK